MKKTAKLLFLFLIVGICSCQNNDNQTKSNATNQIATENAEMTDFKPDGYYDPIGDTVYLDKYRFESLVIWVADADEKPEVFLHFVNYNLKRKAINIHFKNYIIKPEKILLAESDTLNGEISFEGKFLKSTVPDDEDARNETVVLKGKLKIRENIYNLDFTYFPGD